MSDLGKLVAVRSLDKALIKGWTFDFHPNRNFFHVEEEGALRPVRVPIEDLKAVFFIKTLGRTPGCVEKRSFGNRVGPEKKVWIEFVDGEKMAGWSNSFGSLRKGFFVFPADPDSNTEKAYVFRSAIAQLEEGAVAEEAARAFDSSSDEPLSSVWDLKISPEAAPGTYRLSRKGRKRPSQETGDC
jgi:hypothetical protein